MVVGEVGGANLYGFLLNSFLPFWPPEFNSKVLGVTLLLLDFLLFWTVMKNATNWPHAVLICSDPLFPSVSFMLCSPFFHFSKQKVLICISFSFWKKEKPLVLKLKLKVFIKFGNRSMLQFHLTKVRLELGFLSWVRVVGLGLLSWVRVGFELGLVWVRWG